VGRRKLTLSASTPKTGSPDDNRGPQTAPFVVSVVTNFRGLADTTRCVESLLASTYPAHRVVVVDNGSGNADADVIESRFGEQIEVMRARQNLGYGGGANLGIRWAIRHHAEYVWILNNDTVITADAIDHLVRAMETCRRLGVTSPEINAPIGPEAPTGVWYAGGTVSLARAETHHLHRTLGRAPAVVLTEFVTGCAMFLRSEALEDAGVFWERLFLYWEDVDLSLRFRTAGWELGVVPSATITHFAHGAVRSEIAGRYYFRNAILVARRHDSLRVVARALGSLTVGLARGWASALLRRRSSPYSQTRGLLGGVALAFRWTLRRPAEFALGVKPLEIAGGSFEAPAAPRKAR
jgi:GT2 family glycosyltransferase